MARRVACHLDELDGDATVDTAARARLADAVAPRLEELGFTRVENRYGPALFRRHLDHSVVQSVTLSSFARSAEGGRVQPAEIWIAAGVLLPPRHPATPEALHDLAGGWTLDHQAWAAPNTAAVEKQLVDEVLPWLAGTAGRAALAAWAGTDPIRVAPPILRPRVAELLAGRDVASRPLVPHPPSRGPASDDGLAGRAGTQPYRRGSRSPHDASHGEQPATGRADPGVLHRWQMMRWTGPPSGAGRVTRSRPAVRRS
jgi:hypothetical protein